MKKLVDLLPPGQQIELTIFGDYIKPLGVFTHELETHALFYYYLIARRAYEENIKDEPIVYEGHKDPEVNFQQIFISVASMYGIEPSAMSRRWELIDQQCLLAGLPLMPNEDKYRHNAIIRLN